MADQGAGKWRRRLALFFASKRLAELRVAAVRREYVGLRESNVLLRRQVDQDRRTMEEARRILSYADRNDEAVSRAFDALDCLLSDWDEGDGVVTFTVEEMAAMRKMQLRTLRPDEDFDVL